MLLFQKMSGEQGALVARHTSDIYTYVSIYIYIERERFPLSVSTYKHAPFCGVDISRKASKEKN